MYSFIYSFNGQMPFSAEKGKTLMTREEFTKQKFYSITGNKVGQTEANQISSGLTVKN